MDRRSVSDRHLLIVDKDNRHLYELFNVFYDGTQWHAGSGAFFDMNRNDRRPEGWTSADAAGLAILPGLVRYDEAYGTEEIKHAFRVHGPCYKRVRLSGIAASRIDDRRVAYGRETSTEGDQGSLRVSACAPANLSAMQRYGLIVADNGTDMYVTGEYNEKWSNDVLNPAFRALTASDFEVITLGYK